MTRAASTRRLSSAHRAVLATCAALLWGTALAQTPTPTPTPTSTAASMPALTLAQYLSQVETGNLDLQSQREASNAARAAVSVAGVSPDPQLSFGVASRELYAPNRVNAATPLTAGVAFTFETAGKRSARIASAQSNVALTEALLGAAHDQLLIDASAAFVEACRSREVRARKQLTLASLQATVRANETRLRVGDIGALELRQSRIEAQRAGLDVSNASADAETARINLALPLGQALDGASNGATPPVGLDCGFAAPTEIVAASLDLDTFVSQALARRRDVGAAQAGVVNARDGVNLARSNRWVDPVVNVGLTNTPRIPARLDASGATTNSPTALRSLTLGLTLTLPIPLSRLQNGELRQAEVALTQAQLGLNSVALKAQADVRATHARFRAVANNERIYRDELAKESERVLEAARFSYRKGASSLLELLNAQRTADQIALDHLQALADLANATVRLQINAGLRPQL